MVNLRLLQLTDPALPVGGYTHSWGLEAAIARGSVNGTESLESWTRSWLRRCVAPMEGVVTAAVCRSALADRWCEVDVANEMVTAGIAPATLRSASLEMGQQLLSLAATWQWSRARFRELQSNGQSASLREEASWNYCVAFGVVSAVAEASPAEALACFLNQAACGMIAAGVRGLPIGHTHAQQILAYLHDDIEELTRSYADAELKSAGSGCPHYEVLCHEQPQLYTRIFRS